MSGYVTGWVLKHSDVKGATRLVLIVLADHASSDGTNAWPTVETIQAEARLGARSTVQRALRELEDEGAIVKAGIAGRGQGNWTVVMEGPRGAAPQDAAPGAASDASEGPRGAAQTVLNHPEPSCAGSASDEAGVVDVPVQRRLGEDGEPVPVLSPGGEIDAVWEHYVAARQSSPKKLRRTELDPQTRRMITGALKIATLRELKTSIDGLFLSDHHLGHNDRGKTYLDLKYALKGHSGKTDRGQIDNFIDLAETVSVSTPSASVDPVRLNEAKRNVLTGWEMPKSRQAQEMAMRSAAWLAQHGYRVEPDPESGRPTFVTESSE